MKQRLLLALLMVFASVGLIGAQNQTPSENAVPINITIPAGSGKVTIQVKSDNGLKAAPNLFKSSDEKITASGGENTLPYTYTIDQTSSEQTVFFENASGGGTDAWKGLEMVITGPVSSFVVSGDNGAIAESLTSLSFVDNGELETLILGPVTSGNQGNIGYVPALETLNCAGNKLSVIPVKTNNQDITIADYNVGEQTSDLTLRMDAMGTTEHTVMVNDESLEKMFPYLEDSDYELTFSDVTVTGNATEGYTFTKNGAHVDGTFTATLTVDNDRYAGVKISNVKVTVPEPEFELTATTSGGYNLSFQNNGSAFNFENEKLAKGDKLKVTIADFNSTTHTASMQVSGLALVEDETNKENGVYTYLVIGDQNPTITATVTEIPEGKAVVSLYTNVANDNQSAVDLKVSDASIVSNPSVDLKSEVTIKVTAPKGYVLDKVLVDGNEPTAGSDANTYTFMADEAKAYAVEVYFKQGATITTSVVDAPSGKTIIVKANGEPVGADDTLAPETEITIEPSDDTENYKLISLTVNGEDIEKNGSSYTYKVKAGVNNIVATYEDQTAKVNYIYIGLSEDDVEVTSDENLKAGQNITVSLKVDHAASVAGIEKVVFNGEEDNDEPFTSQAKAGENTVVIYAKTAATLTIDFEGVESIDGRVIVKAGDRQLTNGASLEGITSLSILVNNFNIDSKQYVATATYNGKPLPIGTETTVTVKEPNLLKVIYEIEAAPVKGTVKVIPEGAAEKVEMQDPFYLSEYNAYFVAINVTPKAGYGIEDIEVNGGKSKVDLLFPDYTENSFLAVALPGENTATVYLTTKALVSTHVDGLISGTSASGLVSITDEEGDPVVDKSTTLDVNETIQIAVNNTLDKHKLVSVTNNGTPLSGSVDGNNMVYTTTVAVGTNNIVVTYMDNMSKGIKTYTAGAEATFAYTQNGTTIDPENLEAGDKFEVAITPEVEGETIQAVYFNNALVTDDDGDGKYTLEAQAGENTLYVFFNDAAIITWVSPEGTVSVTAGSESYAQNETLEAEMAITATISDITEGYNIEHVYFNGVEPTSWNADTKSFTDEVRPGLNIIHVEYENVAASVNLTQSGNGTVSLKDEDDADVTNETTGLVKDQELTLTATPTGDFTAAKVTLNGAETGVMNNGDGTYTITLVAGVNNINVEFTKADKGNLMVKFDSKVNNIQIEELNGDKYWTVSQEDKIEVPAATLLKVTFQVPDIKNGNVDGIVSAVINGQNYAPLTADADGVYTIGQADLANDRIVLPEGESVLRIYVKTRKTINFDVTNTGYTYNGNPQPVEFTTYPVDVKNDPNLKVLYRYKDGAEYFEEAPTEAGDYIVAFSRPADDQYSEVKPEECYKEFSIQPAKLMVTTLPTVYPEGTTGSKINVSGGAIGYMSNGEWIDVPYEGEFTTVNVHDPNNQLVKVSLQLNEDENPNYDYSALQNIKVGYETNSFKGTHYTINTDNSEVPAFRLARTTVSSTNNALISSSDLLDADDNLVPIFDQGLLDVDCYTLYRIDEATGKEFQVNGTATNGFQVKDLQMSKDNPTVTLVLRVKDNRQQLAIKDTETTFTIKDKPVYNSYPHPFYPSASNVAIVVGDKKTPAGNDVYNNLKVTYTDEKGNMVLEPVNAGTYTVTISYAADNKYFDFTATAEYTIQKRKLNDLYILDPVASPLAAGLTLENSTLLGAAEIPGNYKWEDPTNIPTADDDGGVNQHAYFEPIDKQNFGDHRDVGTVRVRILDGVQVVSAHSNYGKVLVKDQTGTALNMPASVAAGEKLTVSAINTDPTLLELESITVTMIVDGEETTTTIADGGTITFPEEGNVEIEATFKLKDNSQTIVVPDGQRAVVMPKSVRGAKLSKTGVYTVDYGESFTFTVSTLDADKDKVVVSVNGTAIQPTNGVYTISNITEQQNVSVSLTSKTEVKLDIPKEYKLKDGTLIGRVTVVNNTSSDGKVYYNDELTLIAQPVEGVNFSAWSDGNKEDVRKYTVATSEVKLTASFSGVPTGIEDIESASILAGDGYILIKNVADANVTIVGMTGRIQAQQQISGDTQIRVPAGIYVVILENGQDVKQVKVIVR